MKISQLPDQIINQIAAGEVVERPASVVKELVDNAIDSGADRVDIYLEDGGRELVRVVDNGSGISKEDMPSTIRRHWTSKLFTVDDLFNISSLGFRGEALASIASVSEFSIASRVSDSDTGWKLVVENQEFGIKNQEKGGEDGTNIKEYGMPVGTEVVVKNLFGNIPARQNFLKKGATEFSHVAELVYQMALINSSVVFRLFKDEKKVFQSDPNSVEVVMSKLVGQDLSNKMIPIQAEHPQLKVVGWVGQPGTGAARRAKQYIFVNGRPVGDRTVWGAVNNAYGSLIGRHEKPQFIIKLEISPHLVDVNVHPQKKEVKFTTNDLVFRTVQQAVMSGLSGWGEHTTLEVGENDSLPESRLTTNERDSRGLMLDSGKDYRDTNRGYSTNTQRSLSYTHSVGSYQRKKPTLNTQQMQDSIIVEDHLGPFSGDLVSKQTQDTRKIFQLHNLFIVEETDGGINVYDQHAVHERVLYEKFVEEFLAEKDKKQTQPLLIPIEIELDPKQFVILQDIVETLTGLGFEVEFIGDSRIKIERIPMVLVDANLKVLVTEFVEELEESLDVGKSEVKGIDDQTHQRISYMSCRGAVKAGDRLGQDEIQGLLQRYRETKINSTCPHGRPVVVSFGVEEMKKWFKR